MPPTPATPAARASPVRWVILVLLFAASFVAYVLRTNMSVAGDALMRELAISPVQFGTILAAFAWGYALFQIAGGVWGDRLGARRSLAAISVAWGVCTLLVGLVPGTSSASVATIVGALIVLRFLMGVVQAPLYPVSAGAIAQWFPVSGWALPNGLLSSGLTLGSAATGPIIAWLILVAGWRLSFVAIAPLAFGTAAVWWWYARDRPSEHGSVNALEAALILADRPPVEGPPDPAAWRLVLADRQVLLLTASYFCSNYVFYFFFNWLFVYLVTVRGLASLEGGMYAIVPWMAGAIGGTAGGAVCDRLARRHGARRGYHAMPVFGLLGAAIFMVAAAAARDASTAVVLLALCLGFQQLTEGAFWGATTAVGGRYAATACGVLNTGGNIVGGVVALVVPLVAQMFGWATAVASGAGFAVLGAALWLLIHPDEVVAGRGPAPRPAPPGP